MKIKLRHKIIEGLTKTGYYIEDHHIFRSNPNMLYIIFDRRKSKIKSFDPVRYLLHKIPSTKFVQINVAWSEESIKSFSGVTSFGYDIGPAEKPSVYHINHPHWGGSK